MAETLVIRLSAANFESAEWLIVDSSGALVSEIARGNLAQAAGDAESRKIIVLLPATLVLRLSADVPLKSVARIRQALPFALEEQLAGDVELQHFACEKREASGQIPVAVVATELMEQWTALFAENGIKPDALYVESDAVAALPATITVFTDQDRVIIRDQTGETTVADLNSMPIVLELLLDQQAAEFEDEEADTSILPVNLLIYCPPTVHESNEEFWERLRLRVESLDIKLLAEGALPRLASQIVTDRGVNLLQGPYARKTEFGMDWNKWRLAASLFGACLLLTFLLQGASYWQLGRQEASLDQAADAVLRATFTNIGEVPDPWSELRTRLGADSPEAIASGPGFVEALEALAIAFADTPGIQMQTLSFRSGIVDVQLTAPNVEALDQLRQLISGPGKFSADIQSANPKNDKIEGRMQISASVQ